MQELNYLLEKLLQDNMTSSDIQRMETLLHQEENRQAAESLIEAFMLKNSREGIPVAERKIVFETMMRRASENERISRDHNSRAHRVHFLRTAWFRYAAAILLLAGAGAWLYIGNQTSKETAQKLSGPGRTDLAPGSLGALLTLSNGKTIVLDSMADGTLTDPGGVTVIKLSDGQLAYMGGGTGPLTFNTLSTPRGRQFRLTLPDGTNVWLNSASSLQYPTAFTGKTREVALNGEGYFEVAENSAQPFVVKTSRAEVQVLGTDFNLMAYDDEEEIRTALVNGSVKVATETSANVLKPGQEAVVSQAAISVKEANLEEVLAWKEGKFRFDGAKISAIMRQLARWYDVEIVYEGPVSNSEFYGVIPRRDSASQILDALEIPGNVHFQIEEKKIIVRSGPRKKGG